MAAAAAGANARAGHAAAPRRWTAAPAASSALSAHKFRIRPSDRTPSACLVFKKYETYSVWKVIDFGDEGRALDPIDICMKEEGITRPYEAILRLAQMFGIRDELRRDLNRPVRKEREARADEPEGCRPFRLMKEIPAASLRVLGPKVTKEDAEALGWAQAEWVGHSKHGRVTEKHSTEAFPIFMRRCPLPDREDGQPDCFYKVYEPLNPDKGFRFSYLPAGKKPLRYVNGLHELKREYERQNAEAQAAFLSDKRNEGRPFLPKKLPEAFICSGERDALCCRSMGGWPLWFNSETYRPEPEEIREVMRYCDVLYNIPDIDQTGRRKGTELALRFPDIHTVWLPQWLRDYRDNRGKGRKDLRDWMELRQERSDFRALLQLAMPARFWTERVQGGRAVMEMDTDCLLYFLSLHGFRTIKDDDADEPRFVRLRDNGVIEPCRAKDARRFVREWTQAEALPRAVRNLVMNSTRLQDATLANLPEIDPDFSSGTKSSQLFFFPNCAVRVTPEGMETLEGGAEEAGRAVWARNVTPHRFSPLPDFFTITRDETLADPAAQYDITLSGCFSSCLWGFVVNSSRLHWRREMEERFKTREEREAYAASNRFRIDGEGLTGEQIFEQKQNLIAKIFAIGYLLHRHKSPSRAWAPLAMDNRIGEEGQCNGRSGKSFLFRALSRMFLKTVVLSGRNGKLLDNAHVFEQVTRWTDFVLVDDCQKTLTTENFYDLITGSMTVNPKNNHIYTLDFKDSPKFGFTTNYVPKDFDASTEARLLYMVFSDYYHQQTAESDYLESRSIRDDFSRDLFGEDYTEDDWNADVNFCLQCVRFYLSASAAGLKLQPPMDNIMRRKWKADMGSPFEEWAGGYFAPESGNCDRLVVRRAAYESFVDDAKVNRNFYTMNRFTRSLRDFCRLAPWVEELNPEELRGANGRIMRRVADRTEEMVFVRTREGARRKAEARKEETLPF